MLEPTIIYEDEDLLVLNKPSGLLTHQVSKADTSDTVVSWLTKNYPEVRDVYEKNRGMVEWEALRPGIVHRLDKQTSGLLIVARNQKAFSYLKGLFQDKKIQKTYIALVYGQLKHKEGTINAPLGKYEGRQTTNVDGRHKLKAREAITDYRVITEYTEFSLLEVKPRTGRTHQIRVHLKSIGHPLVCDTLYGNRKQVCPSALGRLFLHAQQLEFTALSGKMLILQADLPSELASFLETLPKLQK